jgi:hypothetical protein
MRKIIVGAQVSLDGVMQAPGGPSEDPTQGFKFGGWAMPYFAQEREALEAGRRPKPRHPGQHRARPRCSPMTWSTLSLSSRCRSCWAAARSCLPTAQLRILSS